MQFSAEISDYKIVYNVLKAVSFKEFAVMRIMEQGLKLTLEEMKCVETTVYIPKEMFSTYELNAEDIKFKISLKVLTECLCIFGDDAHPSLKISYKGDGSPLCLLMKHSEESITGDCELRIIEVEDFAELSLAEECNLNKIIVNAAPFVEVLQDLDTAADEFELLLSSEPPFFKICTTGVMGGSVLNISKHSEMVAVFQCKTTTSSKYTFFYLKQILKVMSYATKISIMTGESELLGFQMFIDSDDKQMYVEYYITAQFGD